MRGCACRGTAGFAHVSCLAEQAKILVAEAEENNSDDSQWHRWHRCSLCEQDYHGVVKCALGWACWKTYVGRPETDEIRKFAMYRLGVSLYESHSGRTEEALTVFNAHLDLCRRLFPYEVTRIMCTQMCLGNCYSHLDRLEEALGLHRAYYESAVSLWGIEEENTLIGALGIGNTLEDLGRYGEMKSFLPKNISTARRSLGAENKTTLKLTTSYACALINDGDAPLRDLRKALTIFEDIDKISRRVLGPDHPVSRTIQSNLEVAREKLARAEEASG